MSPASDLIIRLVPDTTARRHHALTLAVTLAVHAAALALMAGTEADLLARITFLLAWVFLNFLWLGILRRPAAAALASFALVAVLVMLSRFKHDKLWTTVDFVDLLTIDRDTTAFLIRVAPQLGLEIAFASIALLGLLAVAWRIDPFRPRAVSIAVGGFASVGAIVAMSLSVATSLDEDFLNQNHVSKFVRSGVEAVYEMYAHGYMDAAEASPDALRAGETACSPPRKLPHIILLHDESSFDITSAPGIKVQAGYRQHFASFDRRARKLVVEGASGPSWFTEFNVLTGLSARSFGRFAMSVTRIAAGRVARGLPAALRRCGYKTFTLYPFYGAFLGSRGFQQTAGVAHYLDMADLGTRELEADSFYFNRAVDIIARERGAGPLFLYVYNVANHFPWDRTFRPELTPDWRAPGNNAEIDEYIRRQGLTVHDYGALLRRLGAEFPTEPFLIVRYGDHQPEFGRHIVDPALGPEQIARNLRARDPRYFTTYYAIDAVNFAPADVSSALDTLDAPYLPLVVQEAAGVPLDPSFAEQKRILTVCRGVFYGCRRGAEARRFNRLLIDAGLIKGL